MRTKLTCQCNLTTDTEGKIYLLVTFVHWIVTQSKLFLILTETLLFSHKREATESLITEFIDFLKTINKNKSGS